MRVCPMLVPIALLAGPLAGLLPAQQVLFFRDRELCATGPVHPSVAAAVAHLCAGPSPAERAAGCSSHVPPGTRLLVCRQRGGVVRLVFDDTLLTLPAGCSREHAIEQIDKTVLAAPGVHAVVIAVRGTDGVERPLRDALGERLVAAPSRPAAAATTGVDLTLPYGALSGRRIAISPGHGYYWHGTLGWTTQRGVIDGLTEDIHTAEICNQYLIPLLHNLGADVVMVREHGELAVDGLADNDGPAAGYAETGSWTTSASAGWNGGTYRFVATNAAVETATATWTIPVAAAGLYPVFAWFRAGTNRTTAATYRVEHTGGTTTAVVDQTRDDRTWAHLGNFWFDPAQPARVTLSNLSAAVGIVIADTVRLGGGLGSIVRGGTTSNRRRWQECARYWAQFAGAPSTVWDPIATGQDNDDDVTTRPRFAEWRGADAFVSLHTNAGGGAGTNTFVYSGGATPGSTGLSNAVHTQLIADLQAHWSPLWTDRGQQQANFGEVRLLSTMPGILIELAFHDTPGSLDHTSLHQPEFRYVAARAIARGVLRHFAPQAPFPPEPPAALRVVQDGARGLRVAWDAAAGATSYTIEQSPDGKGFVEVASVAAPATTWSTGPLPHHSLRSFRVRSWNASGRSVPTEVLTAGTDHLGEAQLLLVQAFDRLDRNVKGPENTGDYLARWGDALRRDAGSSLGFDAASNEAVQLQRVPLAGYGAVAWSLGEESTADETFSAAEQALVSGYLAGGGALLVTGAEVGWDLDAQGSASDRVFFRNVLGATYVADDANVHTLQAGLAGTVSAGLVASTFDDGTGGTYDVDWPDVLAPTTALGAVCLRYGNGLGAGVQHADPVSGARVVTLGVPLETIGPPDVRANLLRQCVDLLLADRPLRAPRTAPLGQATALSVAWPDEAGRPYFVVCSDAYTPGIVLPNGGLLPLAPSFLIEASLQPSSPLFASFHGVLPANGAAQPVLFVPGLPFLSGWPLYFAGFTLDATGAAEHALTNWVRVVLQ